MFPSLREFETTRCLPRAALVGHARSLDYTKRAPHNAGLVAGLSKVDARLIHRRRVSARPVKLGCRTEQAQASRPARTLMDSLCLERLEYAVIEDDVPLVLVDPLLAPSPFGRRINYVVGRSPASYCLL